MARRKRTLREQLADVVRKHNCYSLDKDELFCKICAQIISYDREHLSSRADAHLASKGHRKNCSNGVSQQTISEAFNSWSDVEKTQNEFRHDLSKMLVCCNIPINKIEHLEMRSFLKKWCKRDVPSANSIRYNSVDKLYSEKLEEIRRAVGQNDVYLMMDETNDICDRKQLNVMVGVLDGTRVRSMLFDVKYIETCDAATIFRMFISSCNLLWDTPDPPFERIKLFISDQAPYMIKAGKNIKANLCPNMMHISCLAHCLNRVAESVRENHPLTDQFLACFKEVLRSNHLRKIKYKEMTGLPLPPKPCLTRWTTWLRAAEFIGKHLDKILLFVDSLKSKSRTLGHLRDIMRKPELKEELFSLTDFYFLIEATKTIQTESLRLSDAKTLMNSVSTRLEQSNLRAPANKFDSSIEKNPELEQLFTCTDLAFRIKHKFAPVTSVDVERSFSITKNILSDNRCSFIESNLVKYYVVACNSRSE